MIQRRLRALFCIALVPVASYPALAAPCTDQDVVFPLVFQFADSTAQLDWIYGSLEPKLSHSSGASYTPASARVVDGTYQLTFCVPAGQARDAFVATLGPIKLQIAARPVSVITSERAARETNLRAGDRAIPTVFFLDQPGPNWVIVRSIRRVSLDKPAERWLLEVEIMNFGQEHPGASVGLGLYEGGVACASPSGGVTVPVVITVSQSTVRVASADPEYRELESREAELESNPCSDGSTLKASLGSTGALAPGLTRLRYSIKTVIAATDARPAGSDYVDTLRARRIPAGTELKSMFFDATPALWVTGDRVFGGEQYRRAFSAFR